MRNLTTATLLVGGAILASQSVFGQTYDSAPNDLLFGFQNQAGGGTEDYIINLGAASSIVGKSTVVDLSSYFSLTDFEAVLGSSSSMQGGVIAAAGISTGGNNSSTADLYVTQLRSGGAGTPSVAGSTAPAALTRGQDNSAYAAIGGTLATTTVGSGILDTTKSWESQIDPGSASPSYHSVTGLVPDSTVSTSTVLYEDLWFTTSSSLTGSKSFVYQGYFTLDLTGANPKLTFTSTNVVGSLSAPKIASVIKNGTTVTVVSSNALATHSYQLQETASLSSPVSWVNVGSGVVASGTTVTNTDTTATGGSHFYRVQAQ
ncbi:MAG TPA: hypothetical protein VH280_04405 [Verrucomicrobiae bacterium]|jgi:hypothetical protein|nr:hypothetical protein [Verrucomicrobiae bacterium]